MALRQVQRREVEVSASRLQLPPLLARIYAARGVHAREQLPRELAELLPPGSMCGIDAAVQRLERALENGERILVIGDFDADGATSSALAVLALRAMGASEVDFLVPNRFEFGYGLTPEIVAVAARSKPRLLVTVDNGISSVEGVAAANALGMDVVITDHHLAGPELPAACAIVNPNQPGCGFPSKYLAGVGVVFYVMSSLRTRLRESGWFERRGIAPPNMAEYLDLVALGSVADVVPLDANNRLLVHQGLRRIRARRARPGILALLEVAGRRPERCTAQDLGFAVGPRLNAAGRMDDMSHGILCLLAEDAVRAREWAEELDALNSDRRQIEQGMKAEAAAMLRRLESAGQGDLPWGLCLYEPDWHQGVIGILASRVKDLHHRPVIAFADADQDNLKGSARSIPGLHIRDVLDAVAARHPGLLSKFGGHAMAAGLSLRKADLEAFTRAFDEEVRRQLDPEALTPVVFSDGALEAEEFSVETAELLRDAGPWGQHFPEPAFDGEFEIRRLQWMGGGRHLKLWVSPAGCPWQSLEAVLFNADLPEGAVAAGQQVRLIYRLDVNEWRGQRNLQLMIEALHLPT